MTGCPKCGSYQYESNKIEEGTFDNLLHGAHTAHHGGYPALAAGAFALWGGMRAINVCRRQWRCLNCGHRFNDA